MGSFVSKQILTTQTIGEQLKKTRLGLGCSIKEVSEKTGIKECYLNAVEMGLYSELPGEIYTVEFIKKYASFLRMNSKRAAQAYNSERKNLPYQSCSFSAKGEAYYTIRKMKWVSRSIAAFAVVLLVIYVSIAGHNFFSPPLISVDRPGDYLETASRGVTVSGTARGTEKLYINSQPVNVSENGAFERLYYLPFGINLIHILAEGSLGKKSEKYIMVIVGFSYQDEVAFQNRK